MSEMERRKFFTDGLKSLARDLWKSPVGEVLDRRISSFANLLAPEGLDHLLTNLPDADPAVPGSGGAGPVPYEFARPPGALPDAVDFDRSCTRCGDCVIACPYGVIFTLGGASGPLIDPNSVACQLCADYPCIAACDEGALLPLPSNSVPKFGQARLNSGACRNEPAQRKKISGRKKYCQECKKACPVPGAVVYDGKKLPVFADHCSGCGICISACPAEPVAIRVEIGSDDV
jgi:ferredoxin-type protein NapG